MNKKDYTGFKTGTLTVIKPSKRTKNHQYWLCKCDCGNFKEVRADHLTDGRMQSCGCLRYKLIGEKKKTHGQCRTRIYRIYRNMLNRCYYKPFIEYHRYGGRGIIVCKEWLDNFINFYNWAMANGYSDELSIDRIDPNGNYEPNNCRWVTQQQQQNNKRCNHYITYNGETLSLADWSRKLNIPYWKISREINKNKRNIEDFFNEVKKCQKKKRTVFTIVNYRRTHPNG